MGIKGILPRLPDGKKQLGNFTKITFLQRRRKRADLDAMGLIHVCAYRNRDSYLKGDEIPTVAEFQENILFLHAVLQWDVKCFFDGGSPEEKQPERERRQARLESAKEKGNMGGQIRISSTLIAMCVKVCERYCIPFMVAPQEADMQLLREDPSAIAVTQDSDSIAYGNGKGDGRIVIIDRWGRERFRIINMKAELTDGVKDQYPLYAHIVDHGLIVVHWWAAVMGCDVTAKNGIDNIGPKTFLRALDKISEISAEEGVTTHHFSKVLKDCSSDSVKLSADEIEAKLQFVVDWFSKKGVYYDANRNLVSMDGRVVSPSCSKFTQHSNGGLDPKTGQPFSPEQIKSIANVMPHNLLHNSEESRDAVKGHRLPEGRSSIDACTVAELRGMIIARGGNVTDASGNGINKPELIMILKRYFFLENQRPAHAVYFDRSKLTNGIFSKLDTGHKRTIGEILQSLVFDEGIKDSELKDLFCDVQKLHSGGKFTDDFDIVAQSSPELQPETIYREFISVGHSKKQKNVSEALKRVLGENELLHHSVAFSDDKKSLYILSKQRASMRKDPKTRKETGMGEKPLFAEYLVILHFMITETTAESDGHCLGRLAKLRRSYCALCVAGYGKCYHKAMGMWVQYHHWGVGRPTPKPTTIELCAWISGNRKHQCAVTEPASALTCQNIPGTLEENAEKAKRGAQRNVQNGYSATYDQWGGNEKKRRLLEDPDFASTARWQKFFSELRKTTT